MKNPGLSAFAAPTTFVRSPNHPLNIDPLEDDPELDENDDNNSDYVPPVNFGRWRTPGQSVHVPVHQGPPFRSGEPEDVIHGEVVSPAEQDSADKIINGDHESDSPSANPYMEKAREDLRSPGSDVAVTALSRLLKGERPDTMGSHLMDAAHDWLSQRFTGVRVNPEHGVLEAASPAGSQVVKRQMNLPAIPDHPAQPVYSLTNKHGTFKSDDPQRIVRAMVAFQIMHNEIAQEQHKKDDDQGNGLAATSGIGDWIADRLYKQKPARLEVPPSAVFEPGRGIDHGPDNKTGGYVMPAAMAPLGWWRHQGTAYSPGHHMRLMLDPHEAEQPRNDPRFPGHTFTYAPNAATGHQTQRLLGHVNYFVQDLVHPAARGAGFDLLPEPEQPPAPKVKTPKPPAAGRVPKRGPRLPPHEPPRSLPPSTIPPPPPPPLPPLPPPPKTSAVQSNDLCPVCASGYLEPYDSEHHECLNCGSLVSHVGFDKESSKKPPRGGLGRGLGQIMDYQGDPLNLASGGSENPVNDGIEEIPEGGYVHPLAGEENQNPDEVYQAPRDLLGRQAYAEEWMTRALQHMASEEGELLDEQMGKIGYQPLHKPGQDYERAYYAPMPGASGGYARLTEGTNGGWALTADQAHDREKWTQGGKPFRQRSIPVDRATADPNQVQQFRQPLPDPGNRLMPEKSFLASGHHPIEDDSLNRALRDVATNGRNSQTYRKVLDTAYEPPKLPPESGTQRERRLLSSVNPGLAKFIS